MRRLLHEMYVHASDSYMDSRFLPVQPCFFFLCILILLDTGGCFMEQLARGCKISSGRQLHENFVISFLHIPSSLNKARL